MSSRSLVVMPAGSLRLVVWDVWDIGMLKGWDQAAAELLRSVSIGGFPSIADPKITVKTRVCNER